MPPLLLCLFGLRFRNLSQDSQGLSYGLVIQPKKTPKKFPSTILHCFHYLSSALFFPLLKCDRDRGKFIFLFVSMIHKFV